METENKPNPGPQDSVKEPIVVSKETQEKNQAFKESIGVKEGEDPKEEENRWDFEETNLTIREAMACGALLKDFFEGDGVKLPMRWTPLIALVNRKRTKGPKLTLDSSVSDSVEAYAGLMTKSFFRNK